MQFFLKSYIFSFNLTPFIKGRYDVTTMMIMIMRHLILIIFTILRNVVGIHLKEAYSLRRLQASGGWQQGKLTNSSIVDLVGATCGSTICMMVGIQVCILKLYTLNNNFEFIYLNSNLYHNIRSLQRLPTMGCLGPRRLSLVQKQRLQDFMISPIFVTFILLPYRIKAKYTPPPIRVHLS